jgi:3-methyladenine DNA glycosylase/8-oxoguanine DNA glycosylase
MTASRGGKAITIDVRRPFGFRPMVLSHGWRDLSPFEWDDREETLRTTFLVGERAVSLVVTSDGEAGEGQRLRAGVVAGGPLSARERAEVEGRLAWMFRLEEDFGPFHEACRRRGALPWVVREGLGAFLRNPTLFEELAKILLTTNVSWAGTRSMTRLLLETYGTPVRSWPAGSPPPRAFPAPEAIAGEKEAALRKRVRLGYRAPYLLELAEAVAKGKLRLAALADPARPTEELARTIRACKGFGPYASNAVLLSLGRYDRLILDSWIRSTVARVHFRSCPIADRSIERRYAPWGEWKTLACWFDCAWESWMRDALAAEAGSVS